MSALPPPLPAFARAPWWRRHWALLVVAGCTLGALAIVAFVAALLAFVHGAMTGSGAYRGAMDAARADARVRAALGTPIEDGMWTTGSIATGNGSGHASLSIPIEGPRGQARLDVDARQVDGTWHYRRLVAELPDGPVDLAP